jgi:energy-coupling factor transporter ATP-binding protein EcfA2
MLERFERVNKVGLFEDYFHSPGCDLGEVTLIYGENGVGKSTLAAILDSLRERNAREIIRRRSLPGDVAPTVAVRMNGKLYTFDGRDWDDQLPYNTLEVFFPGFVTRNVHAATGIDPDNRRNLCEFVLGRIAVEKLRRLRQADNEGREALTQKNAIEKDLQLLIKKPDTLETFLGLPNDAKIDEHIDKVRAELKQAQSKDAILARAVPKAVALPTVDRNAITTLLEKSADGIGANVAAVVRAHINQHLDNDGENWLAYGGGIRGRTTNAHSALRTLPDRVSSRQSAPTSVRSIVPTPNYCHWRFRQSGTNLAPPLSRIYGQLSRFRSLWVPSGRTKCRLISPRLPPLLPRPKRSGNLPRGSWEQLSQANKPSRSRGWSLLWLRRHWRSMSLR